MVLNICRIPALFLLCLCLSWGCGVQRQPAAPPSVGVDKGVVLPRGVGLPEGDAPPPEEAKPSAEAVPAVGKQQPQQPRSIDDRYGPGKLGPRVLLHESESVEVPPQRMDLRLLTGIGDNVEDEQAMRKVAAKASSSAGTEAGRLPRVPEGGARAPLPVRLWELREPRAAHPVSPLAPAAVDTRAYLASLGIRSVYDLAPGSRQLALPRRPDPPQPQGSESLEPRGDQDFSPREWEAMIREAGHMFGLDARFIAAMIKVESDFDHLLVSPAGARGAMQIMPETQADLGLDDPFDVWANIHAGCAYIHELLVQYGSVELALAAYNAGPGAVDKYGGIPPYPETRDYVRRVMALWQGDDTRAALVETTGGSAGHPTARRGAQVKGEKGDRRRE